MKAKVPGNYLAVEAPAVVFHYYNKSLEVSLHCCHCARLRQLSAHRCAVGLYGLVGGPRFVWCVCAPGVYFPSALPIQTGFVTKKGREGVSGD